ncbi:MAG TPA: hypothetical protein VH502_01055 [Actinoplanes sp.]
MAVETVTHDDRVLPLIRAVGYAIVPFLVVVVPALLYRRTERR